MVGDRENEPMIGSEDRPGSFDLDAPIGDWRVRDILGLVALGQLDFGAGIPVPEEIKSERIKPELLKPEFRKPERLKPERIKPEWLKPEFRKPEWIKPELSKPEKEYFAGIKDIEREAGSGFLQAGGAHVSSPGELHGYLVSRLTKQWREAKGDSRAICEWGLKELQSESVVSEADVEALTKIVKAVGGKERQATAERVRELYHDLLDQPEASGIGIAIGGIAVDSCCAFFAADDTIETDILGAIAGALVGALFGNPFVGAIVGAALLSTAQEAR